MEIIGKNFQQNCGDTILVTEEQKIVNGKRLYKCLFQKYPYEVFARKEQILKQSVWNPIIENYTFINKEFPQKCGDSLIVLEKLLIKGRNNYKCKFIKYPFEVITRKEFIINGQVLNPQIEKTEFIDKIWPQNCGDFLKVIEKTNHKKNKDILWKCEFINSKEIVEETKSRIIQGVIQLPSELEKYKILKTKETLRTYIQDNFKEKPTYQEVADLAKISRQSINNKIIEYNLQDLIKFKIGTSKQEKELRAYIENFIKTESTCKVLDGKEIDIYISNLKLGFEFNGNYWHSNDFKSSTYHQNKSLLAQQKGINLVHIWEYEWLNKQNILKSLIKSKIGIFEKKIGASKCKIKELDYKKYAQFCNENHLQGECGAKVKLGLFYKDKLIQVMSFGVPRFTDKYEWEILRECSKLGYFILGGKEKLWFYFVKNFSPKNCISYCDFSKFTGSSYERLGFKKERLNKPGFVWYDNSINQVFWRNPYKNQEMKEKGYLKIYDCGQLVFTWYNNYI